MTEPRTIELCGRKRIYTDKKYIDKDNVIEVLNDALIEHAANVVEISFLLNYEKGDQPLKREKKVRKDIDVRVCDNIASQITEFKLSYNWGNPIEIVQRSDIYPKDSTKEIDDSAITLLNNMLKSEYINSKNQELARYIEICGIGYKFIDIKRDYVDGGSVFDVAVLNPMYAFVVYSNDAIGRPMMGVTFRVMKDGTIYYTCYTKDTRFEIKNAIKIIESSGDRKNNYSNTYTEMNPINMIPVVEYNRSTDLSGCFERQITDLDNMNILVSDFTNDVVQNTQAIWWGNDIEFPVDENGEPKPPVSNQWLLTNTTMEGSKPLVNPMSSEFNYSGMLDNIRYRRDVILQKCNVPLRTEPGGGSTGTAMSMSSGWTDAECAACKEALVVEKSELMSLEAILRAIKKSPYVKADSELLKLQVSDIEIHFIRNKTYDMATKANAYATYTSHGINGRDALAMVDATSNIEAVYTNSKEMIDKYQESLFEKSESKESDTEKRNQSDLSDQTNNSPILGNNVK